MKGNNNFMVMNTVLHMASSHWVEIVALAKPGHVIEVLLHLLWFK